MKHKPDGDTELIVGALVLFALCLWITSCFA